MHRSEWEKARADALHMLNAAGIVLAEDERVEITDSGKNDQEHLGLGLTVRHTEVPQAEIALQPGEVPLEVGSRAHQFAPRTDRA